MEHVIDIQNACLNELPFSDDQLLVWAKAALEDFSFPIELTIRFVDVSEMVDLNHTFRKMEKPTNVLAFPSNIPKEVTLDLPFLGDVIICPQVLIEEAQQQFKILAAHWAHILIHGILHLQGFDHIETPDEEKMQQKEIALLAQLGFSNPYSYQGDASE